jgi:hypothetical protein
MFEARVRVLPRDGVSPVNVDTPGHHSQLLVFCLETVLAETARLIAKDSSLVLPQAARSLISMCINACLKFFTNVASLNLEGAPLALWQALDVGHCCADVEASFVRVILWFAAGGVRE